MKRLLFFINPNAGHAEIRGTLMEVLEISAWPAMRSRSI